MSFLVAHLNRTLNLVDSSVCKRPTLSSEHEMFYKISSRKMCETVKVI